MKKLTKLNPSTQIILKDEVQRLKKINPNHKFIAQELKKTFNAPINEDIVKEIDSSSFDADLYEQILTNKNYGY